jgi:hypothetical protein
VLTATDSGNLQIFNCSSACTVTLYASPTNGFYGAIQSVGSTVATVFLNGLNWNGATSVPVLNNFRPMFFWSDGTNYWGEAPLNVGTGLTLTPGSNGVTIGMSIAGASCSSQVVSAISSTGAGTCVTITSAYVSNSIATTGGDINTSSQVVSTHLSSPLPTAQGGSGNGNLTFPSGTASVPWVVAYGTVSLPTSAIASLACSTATATATGAVSTDVISWNPNASIKAVTGYAPSNSGNVDIADYATTNQVNFDVCNRTSASITPGSVTVNWSIIRHP